VPTGDDWLHEPKLDGYRLQVVKLGPTVRLYGRHCLAGAIALAPRGGGSLA